MVIWDLLPDTTAVTCFWPFLAMACHSRRSSKLAMVWIRGHSDEVFPQGGQSSCLQPLWSLKLHDGKQEILHF